MRRSPRTRLAVASVALLATLAFTACGDDDDDASATDPSAATAVDTTTPDDTTATSATGDTVVPDDTSDTTPEGGGEVGARDDYIEAAKGQIGFADEEINDCVAAAILSDDVYAAIESAGLTVADFEASGPAGQDLDVDEAQAGAVAETMAACGDLIPQVVTDADQLACAEEHLTNDEMAGFLALSLFGMEPGEDLQAANDAVEECIDAATTTTT